MGTSNANYFFQYYREGIYLFIQNGRPELLATWLWDPEEFKTYEQGHQRKPEESIAKLAAIFKCGRVVTSLNCMEKITATRPNFPTFWEQEHLRLPFSVRHIMG